MASSLREYHGTVEFKLGGCPWWADSNDSVESRYFVSTLIGVLKVNGWQIAGTMDLTRYTSYTVMQSSSNNLAEMSCLTALTWLIGMKTAFRRNIPKAYIFV